mmetsp:Transcript_114384/g.334414  ORF Transcript_114384/g.334414 Transcript_114384/m.334414 type:complete len:176 (+) Transcript_114384:300-827(+)
MLLSDLPELWWLILSEKLEMRPLWGRGRVKTLSSSTGESTTLQVPATAGVETGAAVGLGMASKWVEWEAEVQASELLVDKDMSSFLSSRMSFNSPSREVALRREDRRAKASSMVSLTCSSAGEVGLKVFLGQRGERSCRCVEKAGGALARLRGLGFLYTRPSGSLLTPCCGETLR